MRLKRTAGVVFLTAALAMIAGGGSSAWAGAGGVPAPQANCLGQANAGGANGGFVKSIATSGPGAFGTLARGFGTSGGAGEPASQNDCG
jgi:hypothetical protein